MAITIRDHLLDSVDHPVLDFFQDKAVENIDDRKKAITVQHLLDMTSGFEWDRPSYAMFGSSDPTKFVLNQPMKTEPGQSFYYNNGNPHVLSALITKLAGQNALDFAKKELFEPLGISDVDWGKPDAQNVIRLSSLVPAAARYGEAWLPLPAQGRMGWKASHSCVMGRTRPRRPHRWRVRPSYANLWWSLPGGGAYLAWAATTN